ncbi:two-component system sensor protein [Duganella sp. FT94W]|uniref:histidine kinase n=1 Tax=Duganella lactea TaxID=2692173 RepID=A0ABW9V6U5_9BURK|nr:ATP-binding protein [Duganella lactea]MYM34492.1 two-component system sensor protein [Duganella lactea]
MSAPLHPRHWSLGVKVGMIVTASLVLLLGSALTSYTLERNTAAATAEMLRTMQTQADIQRLHTQIAEAATGVRGYLLTGRDDFLTPYSVAARQLPATLASLEDKVSDADQRASLRRIRPLLESKLASLDLMRGQRNASAAELQQHLLSSKQILDQLRAEIAVMNAREAELVAQRTAALQGASNRNLWMTITVVAAGLAGTLATLAFTIGLVRRVRLAVENAERLTSDQPLKPTPANTDELGQLAERLHQASVLLAGRASAAQAASQAKTAFLARTSHELRTPLNAILGYAQLLEAGLRAPREREHAEHIRQAGQHLLSLIDEVLDIGRIEAGKLTLNCAPVALAPLVAEALTLMAPMAQQRGVQLCAAVFGDTVAVMADRQRLLQVMLNLLSNAIKYGGGADVAVVQADDVVSLHIDDDGPGIAPEMRARLFTPFDRLGAERGKAEGAGLGLTVSKALIQAMQGDLRYSAKAPRGSRFTLTLAMADTNASASAPGPDSGPPAPADAAPETSTITHRLLCIDDDAATRVLVATLLRRRPHWRLDTATDRASGLAQLRANRPDLLLTTTALANDELRAAASATTLALLDKPLNVPAFYALLDATEKPT